MAKNQNKNSRRDSNSTSSSRKVRKSSIQNRKRSSRGQKTKNQYKNSLRINQIREIMNKSQKLYRYSTEAEAGQDLRIPTQEPSTSKIAAQEHGQSPKNQKFKKFKDSRVHQRRCNFKGDSNLANKSMRTLMFQSSVNSSFSPGQLVTRRLLRSIRRRQNNNNNNNNDSNVINKIGRKKLNFSGILKNTPAAMNRSELEDGEIISEPEDENDCVCIGPPPPVIIDLLDDDSIIQAAPESNYDPAEATLQMEDLSMNADVECEIITSTPKNTQAKKPVPTSPDSAELQKFYKDVQANPASVIPLYETICSEDTFYRYAENNNTLRNSTKINHNNSDDVILIDDSTLRNASRRSTPRSNRKRRAQSHDDSVIFIDETICVGDNGAPPANKALDYIPLMSENNLNRRFHSPPHKQPKKTVVRVANSLLTMSEQKNLAKYNSNVCNPNSNDQGTTDAPLSKKRMVIIDGCNVAFAHGRSQTFSVKGLTITLGYLERLGHEVKIVIPQYRKFKCSEPDEVDRLYKENKIVFTPCKNLPGKSSISYDDRFILQLAGELDAAVISNDNYRDLIQESTAFKRIIENRVIGYSWCNDIFMLAQDPYGRSGPSWEAILNRK